MFNPEKVLKNIMGDKSKNKSSIGVIKKAVKKIVKCNYCKQNMQTASSCNQPYIMVNNQKYKRNTTYFDTGTHCHDCGIVNKKGNIHHFGCDIERCPQCKRQLISCKCNVGKTFK